MRWWERACVRLLSVSFVLSPPRDGGGGGGEIGNLARICETAGRGSNRVIYLRKTFAIVALPGAVCRNAKNDLGKAHQVK